MRAVLLVGWGAQPDDVEIAPALRGLVLEVGFNAAGFLIDRLQSFHASYRSRNFGFFSARAP